MSNYCKMNENEIRELLNLDTIEFDKKVSDDNYYLGKREGKNIRIRHNPYKPLMYKEEEDTIWKQLIL